MLRRKEDRSWRKKIEEWMKNWWEILEARGHEQRQSDQSQRVFWELSSRLPDNCILCADSGSTTSWLGARPENPDGDDGIRLRKHSPRWALPALTPWPPSLRFPQRSVIANRRRWGHADERE